MKYNPRIHYTYGGELCHYRRKGSKNGFTTIPGYKPIGNKAIGIRMPDGTYKYEDPNAAKLNMTYGPQSMIKVDKFANSNVGKKLPKSEAELQNLQRQRQYANSIPGKLSKAARDTTNWVNQAGDNIRNGNVGRAINTGVFQAGRKASNLLNTAGRNIGNTVTNVRKRIGEAWDGSAGPGSAKDKANAANARADRYTQYMRNGDRRSDYSKQMKGAAINQRRIAREENEKYNKSIKGRFENATKNVGNWLNDTRQNVSNAVKPVGGVIDKAGNWLRNTEVGKRIGEAWDGSAGPGSAKDKANAANARADRYTQYMRNGDRRSDYSKQMKGAAINQRRIAREENEKYNKSIKGRAENFVNSLTGAGRNVGNWFNETRNRIGEAWDGSAGAGSAKDKANANKQRASDLINTMRNIPNNSKGRKYGNQMKQQAADALREASVETTKYNKSIKGMAENAVKDLSKSVSSLPRNVRKQAEQMLSDIKSGRTIEDVQGAINNLQNFIFRNSKQK